MTRPAKTTRPGGAASATERHPSSVAPPSPANLREAIAVALPLVTACRLRADEHDAVRMLLEHATGSRIGRAS